MIMKYSLLLSTLLAALTLAAPARADDAAGASGPEGPGIKVSLSAFGTLGITRSDQPWHYQRFIRDEVSVERDTVFGAQADIQFDPKWSATVQARVAPAADHDNSWEVTPSWAFVAYRPDNNWLARAGRLRVPFLLRSETLDVGQTYDEIRLPTELYALAPTSDFDGLNLTHSMEVHDGDLSIDGMVGQARLYKRAWIREAIPSPVPGAPPALEAGAIFRKAEVSLASLVLTWQDETQRLRLGAHHVTIRTLGGEGVIERPVWADLGPGIGYWQTSNMMPGPGVTPVSRAVEWLFTASGEWRLGGGWRVAAEALRLKQSRTQMVIDGWAGYTTVYRQVGAFTPYVMLAGAKASSVSEYWSRQLDTTTVPGGSLLNATMRASADTVYLETQSSVAIGTSYALTPTSKLKAEWLHTHARNTMLIDVPAGEPRERRRRVNVLSASLSFVF